MTAALDVQKQVVTGLVPPQVGEAKIRVAWPSVQAYPAVATLGRALTFTYIGAPLAWLLVEACRGILPNWTHNPLIMAMLLLFGTVIAVAFPIRRDVLAMGLQPLAALLVLATTVLLCLNMPAREALLTRTVSSSIDGKEPA